MPALVADIIWLHEAYYGTMQKMEMPMLFQPGYIWGKRGHKSQPRAVGRCYLDGGHSHSSDWFNVPNVPTGTTCNSGDMTWAYPRTPLVAPSTTGGAGGGYALIVT